MAFPLQFPLCVASSNGFSYLFPPLPLCGSHQVFTDLSPRCLGVDSDRSLYICSLDLVWTVSDLPLTHPFQACFSTFPLSFFFL